MSQPLQYSQPLFFEERPVAAWLGWMATLIAIILTLFLFATIAFTWTIWHHAPGWSRGLLLFQVLLFVHLLIFYRQSRAITILEPSHLQLRLSLAGITFWKRTIHLRDVRSVESANSYDFRSLLQIAGGELRFMTGKTNVRLRLERTNIVVGSFQPAELLDRLQEAIGKPHDSASVTQSA